MHSASTYAVVFDVGGVLIDWNPAYLYNDLIPDDTMRDFFLTHVCPRTWNGLQDAGLMTWHEAVAQRARLFPEFASLIAAYDAEWPKMVKGPIAGTVACLQALHAAQVPLYAITNFNAEKWAIAQALYPFLTLFRGVIVSGVEKMLKPDPGIYHLLCQRYDLDPKTCLFIDDVPANVDGARQVGMHGHVFNGADGLQPVLMQAFPHINWKDVLHG